MAPRALRNSDPLGLDDEGDDKVKDADERAAREVGGGAKDDDEEDVVVDLDDDGKDDDDDDDDGEEKPASRRQKRRERGENLVKKERERAERLETENRELRQRFDSFQGQLLEIQRGKQEPVPDEIDKESKTLENEQAALTVRWQNAQQLATQGKLPQSEADKLTADANDLRKRIARNDYRRAARDEGGGRQQVTQQDIHRQTVIAAMRMNHPDVMSHREGPDAFAYHAKRLLRAGHVDNEDTVAAAMDAARKDLGIVGKRPAPSDATRRRTTSSGRGPTGGGDDKPRSFTMTKEHRRLANAAYGHIKDPKERYKKYVADQLADDK